MGELGFMGMMVPEEWGGSGFDTISYVIAIEEIAAVELATSTIMSVNNSLVCQVLLDQGTDKQKNNFLKPLARGDKLGAYSLSEPQSGSDASNMKTYAEKNGDHYIINGTKNWVTSGQNSDFVIFFCLTNKEAGSKGISAFIIEKGTQLDNEKIISIVQEVSDKYSFFEGQRVKVVKSNYRSRVQPFNN